MNTRRLALLSAVLMAIILPLIPAITKPLAAQTSKSTIIDNWSYNARCNCHRCARERHIRSQQPKMIPSAERTAPKIGIVQKTTEKQDRATIIASIKNNPSIPESIKSEILNRSKPISTNLISKPIQSPISITKKPFSLIKPKSNQTVKNGDKQATPQPENMPPQNGEKPEPTTITIPEIKIQGGEKNYGYGELIRLWVMPPEKINSLHSISYSWVILPKTDVEIWPDSTKIVFASGTAPKTYNIILTASYVFVIKPTDENTTPQIVQKIITQATEVNIGNGAQPPINPPNTPNLSGLAASSYNWVRYVKRTTSYKDASVKVDALKIANNFMDVADEIDAENLKDINTIIKATQTKNDAAITNREEWLPWFERMADYLKDEFGKGTLTSPSQYSNAWKDIAKGLTAASK